MKEIISDMPSPELSESFIREQFDCMCNLCEFLEEAISKEAKRRQAFALRQLEDCEDEEDRGLISVSIDDGLFEVN